jgi:hypothetical protein
VTEPAGPPVDDGRAGTGHAAKILWAAFGLALCGCTQPGDFGRPSPSVITDEVFPVVGRAAASSRGEPVSAFMLTDDEKVLRERAYMYLSPFWPERTLGGILAELRRSRILPAAAVPGGPEAYFAGLMSERWRSSRAPYRQLIDDIAADRGLLAPFFATARRIARVDGIRLAGLAALPEIAGPMRGDVDARIVENEDLVRFVRAALAARIAACRMALHRLLLEIPEEDGVAAEQTLASLEAELAGSTLLGASDNMRAAATASSTRSYFPGYRD